MFRRRSAAVAGKVDVWHGYGLIRPTDTVKPDLGIKECCCRLTLTTKVYSKGDRSDERQVLAELSAVDHFDLYRISSLYHNLHFVSNSIVKPSMSSNVGLSTPRGSGTSGYVQRNLSHLKPRDAPYPPRGSPSPFEHPQHRQRQPDAQILEHDRRREIEVQVFELRDRLEDEEVDEDEIEEQCAELRKKLSKADEDGRSGGKGGRDVRALKSHQVHELARAKIEESEKLRRALGIKSDYEEGGHWKRQEERRREEVVKAGREESRREETD